MSNTAIFTPSGVQHKRLKKLAAGGEDVTVSPEALGPLYQDGDDLKTLAWDYYNMENAGRRNFIHFMELDEPALEGEFHIVRKKLTPLGQQALAALEIGWFWNSETNEEAVQATFDFYRDLMNKGKFSVQHADWIVGNADERFRELRNEVVYFKLKAKRIGDFFVEDKDASLSAGMMR